ncbi:MAG TPA: energy transducer TonB [Puia sp.]
MKQKTTNRLMQGSVIMSIIFGMMACNGADSSDKTANDSLTTAASATKVTDSAASVKTMKKKKGQMFVVMPMDNSAKMVKDAHGVYNRAEKSPEFPGGQAALSIYINKYITYPQAAIENGTSGTVHVTFVVDEHGKVIKPQAMDGKILGDDIVNQTLSVFNNMPMWTPGTVHDKKVKTRMEVPVTFQLADSDL